MGSIESHGIVASRAASGIGDEVGGGTDSPGEVLRCPAACRMSVGVSAARGGVEGGGGLGGAPGRGRWGSAGSAVCWRSRFMCVSTASTDRWACSGGSSRSSRMRAQSEAARRCWRADGRGTRSGRRDRRTRGCAFWMTRAGRGRACRPPSSCVGLQDSGVP